MKNNKGQVLIVVYMVIAFFLIVSAALVGKSFTDRGIALRNRLTAEAFYLAEGAVENSISKFISAIANYQISPSIANYNIVTAFSTFGGATVNTAITRLEPAERRDHPPGPCRTDNHRRIDHNLCPQLPLHGDRRTPPE
jgi:hypothetical protein